MASSSTTGKSKAKLRRGLGNRKLRTVEDDVAELKRKQRRTQVVELRGRGYSFEAIGVMLQISGKQCQRDFWSAVEEARLESVAGVEHIRVTNVALLRKLIDGLIEKAVAGSALKTNAITRIIRELGDLYGLHVRKHELTGADGVPIGPIVMVPSKRNAEDEPKAGAAPSVAPPATVEGPRAIIVGGGPA